MSSVQFEHSSSLCNELEPITINLERYGLRSISLVFNCHISAMWCTHLCLLASILLLKVIRVTSSESEEKKFDPYADNGGTIIGIAGYDFVLVAADTRLSEDTFIRSRDICRLTDLNPGHEPVVLAGAGCWSDYIGLTKVIMNDIRKYSWECKRDIDANAVAHLISSTLFSRRTFPFYTFSCLAGMDDDGYGALYQYDAVGSFERVKCLCVGNGQQLLQPLLDDLGKNANSEGKAKEKESEGDEEPPLWSISVDGSTFIAHDHLNMENLNSVLPSSVCVDIGEEEAVSFVKEVFKAAAEREVTIGDGLVIWVIRKEGEENGDGDGNGGGSVSKESEPAFTPRIAKLKFPLKKT